MLNINSKSYIGFINLEEAFNTINWNLLMTTLKNLAWIGEIEELLWHYMNTKK
jgi:hypothetical protein